MQRVKNEDKDFLKNPNTNSYVHWYLATRKLVSFVSTVAQYRTEEIPATLSPFRKLDHTDKRLYKSGLLKDVIESHFWLLENMGQPSDTVYKKMSISIDFMLENLSKDKVLFKGFSSIFPFISACDYTKWENQATKDYFVFATPTMFLLDTEHKILLRPNSVKQIDAWFDYALADKKD